MNKNSIIKETLRELAGESEEPDSRKADEVKALERLQTKMQSIQEEHKVKLAEVEVKEMEKRILDKQIKERQNKLAAHATRAPSTAWEGRLATLSDTANQMATKERT